MAVPSQYYTKEKLKEELGIIIDQNPCCFYKVSKIASPNDVVKITIELDFNFTPMTKSEMEERQLSMI